MAAISVAMDDETPIDLATYAKAVGKELNANSFGKQGAVTRRYFPKEWKDVCLEIMLELKDKKREELGYKRLGWSYIRDMIMSEDDDIDAAGKIIERDQRLTRRNLETWAGGSELSDDKFSFIDDYISRMSLIRDANLPLLWFAKEKYDRHTMKILARLYQPKMRDSDEANAIAAVSGQFLVSKEISNTWFKYIIIRFDYGHSGIIKITCAYCSFDIHAGRKSDMGDVVFYDGFLIPFRNWYPEIQEDKPYINPHHSRCIMKLVRPEFEGDGLRGYAEGELEYKLWLKRDGNHELTIIADYPSTLLSPCINTLSLENRYYPTEGVQTTNLDRLMRENRGEKVKEDFDKSKTYRYRIEFNNTDVDTEFFSELYSRHYKGFIF